MPEGARWALDILRPEGADANDRDENDLCKKSRAKNFKLCGTLNRHFGFENVGKIFAEQTLHF